MRKFTKSLMALALLFVGVGGVKAQTALDFDAFGKATIAKGALVGAGGLTYDPATGALSSDGTEGTLTLEFTEPVDLKNLKHFNVTQSGSTGDILDCLRFFDEDGKQINQWNSIKLSNLWNANGIDDNATNAFLNNKPVKKLVWPSAANDSKNGKTATITSVEFSCKTIACAKAGETQLNTLPWNKIDGSGTAKPDWNMNGSSDTYYGNYSGDPTHYADLTSYSELRVYCTDNTTGFRAFFINADASATFTKNNSDATWHETEKYYSLDLTTISKWEDKVALKSIKSNWGPQNVTNIVVYNTPAANAPQYTLSGSGMQLAETVAALADATVTCIDATGVTGITTNSEAGRTLLTSANPNCLFLGTSGIGGLANTQNVITSGTCDNLELVDGKPFKAPSAFTATAAKFTKSVSDAGYATMVMPFAAALPTGVKAYNLTSISGTTVVSTDADAITADKPVLIEAAEASYEFTATDAAIAATAEGVFTNGLLNGTYAPSSVVGDGSTIYVLANKSAGVGFYKLAADQKVPEGKAYLVYAGSAPDFIGIEGMNLTGIETVNAAKTNNEFFNLAGLRVSQPAKGLYIVNGRKVVMK